MGLFFATLVLWLAAITRVVVTIRRPDPARITMTSAAVCVALAFTMTLAASWFDAAFGWPNGAELIQHLLFSAAAFLTLLFLAILRTGELRRRTVAIQGTVCALISFALIVLFAVAPVHDRSSTNFVADYSTNLHVLLYRAIFYIYLIVSLVSIARTCLRHGFTDGDRPRSLSLLGIGAGATSAAVASTAGGAQMLLLYNGSGLQGLSQLNSVAIAVAGLLAGIGVLVPIPVDAFLRWRRARSTCHSLSPLWSGLTTAVPDVVLPVQPGPSPLVQVELASARRRIEIADALSRIRVNQSEAEAIKLSNNPPAALGRVLRDRSAWAASGSTGVVAADLLEVRSTEEELEQFLAVAGAYQAAP